MDTSEHVEKQTEQLVIDTLFKESKSNRRANYVRTAIWVVIFALSFYITNGNSGPEKNTLRKVYETETFPGNKAGKAVIAILPIQGIITGNTVEGTGSSVSKTENLVARVRVLLQEIKKEKNLKLLMLFINSPGGSAIASDEIYRLLLNWKTESQIPVIAYFHSIAASGGYFIAQAADKIVANEGSLTGSIGVIFSALNYTELAKNIGIEDVTIKTGPFKDIGSPLRNMTKEEREIFEILLNQSFERFLHVIATGRAGKLDADEIRRLADGRIYSGLQAHELKLVDETASFDEMLQTETANLETHNQYGEIETVVYVPREKKFLELLKSIFTSQTPYINIPQKSAPEMLYMWRAGMQ